MEPNPLEDREDLLEEWWDGLLECLLLEWGTEEVKGLGCERLDDSFSLRLCRSARMLVLFLRISLLHVTSLVCRLVNCAASLSLPPLANPFTILSNTLPSSPCPGCP